MADPGNQEPEFIQVRDVKVHLLRVGRGAALLYLHGEERTGVREPFVARLARDFDVIAPDHPGFGQTERPDWLDRIDDMIYHYVDLLDHLGLEKVNVVGESFGGWLAAELAIAHPERIARLALVAAAGLDLTEAPITDLFAIAPDELPDYLFADPQRAAEGADSNPSVEVEQERHRGRFTLAHLAWNPLLCNPALRRRLYRISCPTRVFWGAQDRFIPVAHGEAYVAGIPDAELILLEDCGHVIQREEPEQLGTEIKAFFESGGA